MSLRGSQQQKWVVRNRGGGTSACCANHPVAAPARIKPTDRSVQLKLEQRADNEGSRNGARVYFADECVEGHYHPDRYTALQLLGKTFSVTLDLSSALCSCNVAWYLVPMRSNSDPGTCDGDFYCDANKACWPCRWVAQGHRPLGRLTLARIVAWKIGMASGARLRLRRRPTFKRQVCGVNCDEMDLVEANKFAFHSAAHTAFDGSGRSNGWGGGNAHRAFGSAEYGPGGSVIDTNAPFRVTLARPPVRPWSSPVPQVPWCVRPGSRLLCHRRSRGLERDRDYAAAESRAGVTPLFSGAQLVCAAHECVL